MVSLDCWSYVPLLELKEIRTYIFPRSPWNFPTPRTPSNRYINLTPLLVFQRNYQYSSFLVQGSSHFTRTDHMGTWENVKNSTILCLHLRNLLHHIFMFVFVFSYYSLSGNKQLFTPEQISHERIHSTPETLWDFLRAGWDLIPLLWLNPGDEQSS